jgi:hypothetical protein
MDLDLGEMFLNFPLDPDLHKVCGVDLRPYLGSSRHKTMWMRWERCMIGLMSSPYVCVKTLMIMIGYESVMGDWHNPNNAIHWSSVVLNLHGMESYSPALPWVRRVKPNGRIAGGLPTFVDDLRPTGDSEEACWQVGHQVGCRLGYLGIQVTSRKLRPPQPTAGPLGQCHRLHRS